MLILRLLGRLLAVLSLGVLLLGGVEYLRGRRGPTPGPTPETDAEGRALLRAAIDGGQPAAGAAAPGDTVAFAVHVATLRASPAPRRLDMRLELAGRSARFTVSGRPGEEYRYDGATERVSRVDGEPLPGPMARILPTLLPSVVFWSLVPGAFDDATARVWRLPDREGRPRVAVRWPGEADWFVLDIDPDDGRMTGLEFVDARFGVFFRWRGVRDGNTVIDGLPLPGTWRFRSASPVIDGLFGGRDLATLRYAPLD
jgi:hypothetical protein